MRGIVMEEFEEYGSDWEYFDFDDFEEEDCDE